MKKLLLSALTIVSAQIVLAADHGPGNGNPTKVDAVVLTKMILDPAYNLKASMQNYLKNLQVDKIDDAGVRTTFQRMGGELKMDIDRTIYETGPECRERFYPKVAAATKEKDPAGAVTGIGARAPHEQSVICFDVSENSTLLQQVKDLSYEEALKRVASLAFHEHVHHFQEDIPSQIEANEYEAYQLAAYVRSSATFAQVPLMTWSLGTQRTLVAGKYATYSRRYCAIDVELKANYSLLGQTHWILMAVPNPLTGLPCDEAGRFNTWICSGKGSNRCYQEINGSPSDFSLEILPDGNFIMDRKTKYVRVEK
jgi:hypothetical protein